MGAVPKDMEAAARQVIPAVMGPGARVATRLALCAATGWPVIRRA